MALIVGSYTIFCTNCGHEETTTLTEFDPRLLRPLEYCWACHGIEGVIVELVDLLEAPGD